MEGPAAGTEKRIRHRYRWPLGALTMLAVAVSVVAIVLLGDDGPEEPGGITVPNFGVAAGSEAPDFTVTLFDGNSFSLSGHLADDGRPVLLNLWASWCPPCRDEMPHLDEAARRHPDVLFLGVAVDDSSAAAQGFAAEIGATYPLALDEGGRVDRLYPSFGLPATYVIGADGRIVRTVYGAVTEALIAELVEQAGSSG